MGIALRVPALGVMLLLVGVLLFFGGLLLLFEALSFLAISLPLGPALFAYFALVLALVMFAFFLVGAPVIVVIFVQGWQVYFLLF